jgi:hypothetical protein
LKTSPGFAKGSSSVSLKALIAMPDNRRFIASGVDSPKSGVRESSWSGVSSQNPSILPIMGIISLRVDSWRSAREFMGNCYYFRRIRCSYTAQNYSIGEVEDKPDNFFCNLLQEFMPAEFIYRRKSGFVPPC